MAESDSGVENFRPRTCSQCLRPLLEDQDFLTCHGCFEELHCCCFKDPIPPQAYNILKEELSSVFIFCPTCKVNLFSQNVFGKQPVSINLESRLETIETQMSKLICMWSESKSTQSHKTSLLLKSNSRTGINNLTKKTVAVNGHGSGRLHSFNRSPSYSSSSARPRPKTGHSEKRDFGLALSGHDQFMPARSGSRSPLDKELSPKSNSNLGLLKSKLPVSKNYSRQQPYIIPGVSGQSFDQKLASEALRSCCFRKQKNDDIQEVLK